VIVSSEYIGLFENSALLIVLVYMSLCEILRVLGMFIALGVSLQEGIPDEIALDVSNTIRCVARAIVEADADTASIGSQVVRLTGAYVLHRTFDMCCC
jgi:hypothetical protein